MQLLGSPLLFSRVRWMAHKNEDVHGTSTKVVLPASKDAVKWEVSAVKKEVPFLVL